MSSEIVTDRTGIFRAIRPLMARYAPPLQPRTDVEGRYELWSPGPVAVGAGRQKDVFFAGLIIQSSYVGFYFMPLAADEDRGSVFEPELLALLKGKSCFHVKRLDDGLLAQISAALDRGRDIWVARGWIAA